MKPRRDERSEPTEQVEQIVYDAMCDLGWVIPQTEEDVEEAEWILGETKTELPKQLRDPYAVFDRICPTGEASDTNSRNEGGDAEEDVRVFGSLIHHMRCKKKLSVEKLARKARVEIDELLKIEADADYEPKPRTVHQLANTLGLPKRTLVKLSNMTNVHDGPLRDAAVRFAAHSNDLSELSRDERKVLAEFVKFLVSNEKNENT